MSRPSIYSDELAATICMRLIAGESLRAICGDDEMPAKSTVLHWVVEDREGFADQYARAREAQAYEMADDLLAIADDGRNDTYLDDEGRERVNHDHIQRSKLRVDTRKWVLSRMLPKLYGNKTALEHTGPGGGPIEVKELSDEELAKKARQLTNRVGALVAADKPSTNGKH